MENKIVCQLPRNYFKRQTSGLPLNKPMPVYQLPMDHQFRFDSNELWALVRAFETPISQDSFHSIFLVLGLQSTSDWQTHINVLVRFNYRFRELAQMGRKGYSLRVRSDDRAIVEWLWALCVGITQSATVPLDLCFELCSQLFDLNIPVAKASTNTENLGRYHVEINKPVDNVFVQSHKQLRQLINPFLEHLPNVINYVRGVAYKYNDSTVYGYRPPETKPTTKIIEAMITIDEEPSVFEKLYKHSQQLRDKEKMYQYQRDLDALKKTTFSPQLTSPARRTTTRTTTPKKTLTQPIIPRSPSVRSPSATPTEIKGFDQMVDRLKRGRDMQMRITNYWDDQSAKNAGLAQRSASTFELTAHKYPFPKPVLYVDVTIALGKNQRIGLYGSTYSSTIER